VFDNVVYITATTISGVATDGAQWTLINPKQNAFYRVQYDAANRAAIASQLLADHEVWTKIVALGFTP